LSNAKRVVDYKVENVKEYIEEKKEHIDSWDKSNIPKRGIDFIDKLFNVFFNGHHEDSSLTNKLIEIKRYLNIRQDKFENKQESLKEVIQKIDQEYHAENWEVLFSRWDRYKKEYFCELPLLREVDSINQQCQSLNTFCKNISKVTSDKDLVNAFHNANILQERLDDIAKYSDEHFGNTLPEHDLSVFNRNNIQYLDKTLMKREKKPTILLVEDKEKDIKGFKDAFHDYYNIRVTNDENSTIRLLENNREIDLVILDLDLVGDENYRRGLNFIPKVISNTHAPVIVYTKSQDKRIGYDAMQKGAKYFFYKGDFEVKYWLPKFEKVITKANLKKENIHLKKIVEHYKEKNAKLEAKIVPFITASPSVEKIKKRLEALADIPDKKVLLIGETGVGKEVAARYYYQKSNRFGQPFIAVNLAGTSEHHLESKLFGHIKGAFTDAIADRTGLFKMADKGILFLDEIGEIDEKIQTKLLRVLEDKTILPVGSSKPIKVDVQIIAATNKDLTKAIQAGEFRADLYQRLKGYLIRIPPLRERREDIIPIILHYLDDISESELYNIMDKDVIDFLLTYNWPRNIRELRDTIDNMKINQKIEGLNKLTFECLPEEMREGNISTTEVDDVENTDMAMAKVELQQIDAALNEAKGRKGEASKLLNLDADQMRYRIVVKYKELYPNLVKQYPNIYKAYKKYL